MKKIFLFMPVLLMTVLAACGNGEENDEEQAMEEIKSLNVEFQDPEKAETGETVELKAIVTYGDEKVKDATEMKFEYWKQGNKENSTMVESNNNGDGTYTAEVTFDTDGVYEMFAHTTAKTVHTMPKKSITVGDGANTSQEKSGEASGNHGHSDSAEGFGMHFMKPEDVKANQETDLIVHLQMDNEPMENANVSYEVIYDSNSEKHEWVETEEAEPGEYTGTYSFEEAGNYTITIHVKNDEGLHEHKEFNVEVGQ
ncbi:FixH family protein [Virgibacillus doumboii]|uniref:FixH family protein n=1 Tax=Virgibacillus doumboii TaxID=2697503 RepID=UPI0013DEC032|nr:FixH family protein [Virgibacillus doumboii]